MGSIDYLHDVLRHGFQLLVATLASGRDDHESGVLLLPVRMIQHVWNVPAKNSLFAKTHANQSNVDSAITLLSYVLSLAVGSDTDYSSSSSRSVIICSSSGTNGATFFSAASAPSPGHFLTVKPSLSTVIINARKKSPNRRWTSLWCNKMNTSTAKKHLKAHLRIGRWVQIFYQNLLKQCRCCSCWLSKMPSTNEKIRSADSCSWTVGRSHTGTESAETPACFKKTGSGYVPP